MEFKVRALAIWVNYSVFLGLSITYMLLNFCLIFFCQPFSCQFNSQSSQKHLGEKKISSSWTPMSTDLTRVNMASGSWFWTSPFALQPRDNPVALSLISSQVRPKRHSENLHLWECASSYPWEEVIKWGEINIPSFISRQYSQNRNSLKLTIFSTVAQQWFIFLVILTLPPNVWKRELYHFKKL